MIVNIKKKSSPFILPLSCSLFFIYLELVFVLSIFGRLQWQGFISCVFFSAAAGLLLTILSTLGKTWLNKFILTVISTFISLLFSAQVVYYSIFSSFFSLYSMSEGGQQVMQFWRMILSVMIERWLPILLMLLPLPFLFIFGLRWLDLRQTGWKTKVIHAGVLLLAFFAGLLPLQFADSGHYSPKQLYFQVFSPALCANEFGLLTTMRLDIVNELRGTNDQQPELTETTVPVITRQANMLDIDFDSLIQSEQDSEIQAMHRYFRTVQPTLKNEYTGLFKGKNLIMVVAESFSPLAIDKKLTPTLYKLSNEGFQFSNFYTPIWPVSTSDGEYTSATSLIPRDGVWSMTASAKIKLPFTMGRLLLGQGYRTYAYHDHEYTFYKRNLSHPNMGYEVFKGVGNGLTITEQWPESDVEMINASAPDYLGNQPFATYYMTVSAHLEYTRSNAIARKNWPLVENLPYSEAVKSYLAGNIELDRALQALIEQLAKAGEAENTVIALYADHYPYGLSNGQINELAGHPVDENAGIFKNALIIWHQGIQRIVTDKPGSNLDIVPTLANLFGLPFDSRLLMGRDLLSDTDNTVVFANRSWLNDKGFYDSLTREFTTADGQHLDQDAVDLICRQVDARFTYSGLILKKDYYARLGLVP